MAKHGKKYRQAREKIDRSKRYSVEEAIALLRDVCYARFNESVDLDVRLGVNPRNADQQVRGTVVLPHGTGKTVRVLVFAKGEAAEQARAAGADHVGENELIEQIQGGWTDFDACVATPDMMRDVSKIGRILGPRGMMPNPKTGTVTADVEQVVKELKAGKVEYRVDRFANVHVPVGRSDFEDGALVENIRMLLDTLIKARPASVKGTYMKSVSLSTTMSPGVPIRP